jgi:hypothetical protein
VLDDGSTELREANIFTDQLRVVKVVGTFCLLRTAVWKDDSQEEVLAAFTAKESSTTTRR